MKLDREERINAAALDQAELNDANERGAGARIEFKREGHAKVTITISRELVERARALDLTTGNSSPRRSVWPSRARSIYPAHIPRDGTDGSIAVWSRSYRRACPAGSGST